MLYTGEQFDSDLGQYYLRARYYDPSNGRFNRLDPFAGSNFDPQSLHKYDYGRNDPVMVRDPSGLFSLPEITLQLGIGKEHSDWLGEWFRRKFTIIDYATAKERVEAIQRMLATIDPQYIVSRVFPQSWKVSGNKGGVDRGWYAVHCATYCMVQTLNWMAGSPMGLGPQGAIAISGLWEIVEILNSEPDGSGDPGWGYEPQYDRLTDLFANSYGAAVAAPCCQVQELHPELVWYVEGEGKIEFIRINAARKCCDKKCADAQPVFESVESDMMNATGGN